MSGATIVGHELCREAIQATPCRLRPGSGPRWTGAPWSRAAVPDYTRASRCGRTTCAATSATWAPRRTPRTTRSFIFRNAPWFSPATCCSTAAPVRAARLGQRLDRGAYHGAPPARRPDAGAGPRPGLRTRGHRRHAGLPAFVQQTARQAKAAGLSPLDAARATDLGAFKDLLDSERIVGNLHRAYLELDGPSAGPRSTWPASSARWWPTTAAARCPVTPNADGLAERGNRGVAAGVRRVDPDHRRRRVPGQELREGGPQRPRLGDDIGPLDAKALRAIPASAPRSRPRSPNIAPPAPSGA